jgi:hypothetical protein
MGSWMYGKHSGLRDITGALADGTEDEKLAHVFGATVWALIRPTAVLAR